MRFRLAVIILLIGPMASAATATEPFRIRVLCYNIHHGRGVDGNVDLERIANVISGVSPDVVALQEVDRNTRRTNGIDQAADLAHRTSMQAVFGKNLDFQGGEYGNAVLTKFPVTKSYNVQLPNIDDGEPRGVLVCELAACSADNSPSLTFFCTHLDHRPNHRERLASVKLINRMSARLGTAPAILAGDLNATEHSNELGVLRQHWKIANDAPRPTVPVGEPSRQIDFILCRPPSQWKTVEVRVLNEAVASDHRAIFAVLEWSPSRPRKL